MKEPLDIGQVAQPKANILQSYRGRLGLTTAALLVVLERIESTPAIANRAVFTEHFPKELSILSWTDVSTAL